MFWKFLHSQRLPINRPRFSSGRTMLLQMCNSSRKATGRFRSLQTVFRTGILRWWEIDLGFLAICKKKVFIYRSARWLVDVQYSHLVSNLVTQNLWCDCILFILQLTFWSVLRGMATYNFTSWYTTNLSQVSTERAQLSLSLFSPLSGVQGYRINGRGRGGPRWTRKISCKIDTDKSHTLQLHGRQPSPQEEEGKAKGNALYEKA